MTEVFRLCDDYITRWAALDPVAAGMVGLSGVFGAATDYGPDGYAAREELPDGSRWTFERACEVLRERGRAAPHRVHPGGPLPRLARPGHLLQARRAGLAGGPRPGNAAPRVRPEAVAHRRAQPRPDRPGRPHRGTGRDRKWQRL